VITDRKTSDLSLPNDKKKFQDLLPMDRQTIEISDGVLAEYPGIPAKKIRKIPEELFTLDSDTSKISYSNWTDIISQRILMRPTIMQNLKLLGKKKWKVDKKQLYKVVKKKITKFSLACFPDVNKLINNMELLINYIKSLQFNLRNHLVCRVVLYCRLFIKLRPIKKPSPEREILAESVQNNDSPSLVQCHFAKRKVASIFAF
jgi:hypothetical protein